MVPAPSPKPRLEFLDALRAVAALLVVFLHVSELFPFGKRVGGHVALGVSGVTCFFLVSGFIVPYSLERAGSLGKFWIGRFFRLYPLYWAILLPVLAVAFLAPGAYAHADKVSAADGWTLPANFAMVQEWFHRPSLVGLAWTLSYELAFYLACSVLFLLGVSRRSGAVLILPILAVAYLSAPWKVHSTAGPPIVAVYFGTFFAGTALFRLVTGEDRSVLTKLTTTAWFVLVGWLCLRGMRSEVAGPAGLILGQGIFLAGLGLRSREMPRPLLYLGRISYSVYLLHGAVLAVTASLDPTWRAVSVVALTALLAPVTFRWIEEPAIAMGRRLAKRSSRLPDADATVA